MDLKTSLLARLNDPTLLKTDALAKGGQMVGGHRLAGHFFQPTVISEASADMLCARVSFQN